MSETLGSLVAIPVVKGSPIRTPDQKLTIHHFSPRRNVQVGPGSMKTRTITPTPLHIFSPFSFTLPYLPTAPHVFMHSGEVLVDSGSSKHQNLEYIRTTHTMHCCEVLTTLVWEPCILPLIFLCVLTLALTLDNSLDFALLFWIFFAFCIWSLPIWWVWDGVVFWISQCISCTWIPNFLLQ